MPFPTAVFVLAAGLACVANAAVTLPPTPGKADYQLGGSYTPDSAVQIVTRDRTSSPVSGKYNICYINAFQTQADDASWWQSICPFSSLKCHSLTATSVENHDDLILRNSDGSYFEDPDWPGEYMLDTGIATKRTAIATILNGWIQECKNDGFNAIEPDNLDTFTRSNGLLTKAGNLALAQLFTTYAHGIDLAVGQKNTGGELGSSGKTTAGFDFAIAEECQYYDECSSVSFLINKNSRLCRSSCPLIVHGCLRDALD